MRHLGTTLSPPLLVMGIDPGSTCLGWAVVSSRGGGAARYVASGRLQSPKGRPLAERLQGLHRGLLELMEEFRPQVAVVEKMFFARSVRSALSLGHARGVVLLTVAQKGLGLYEYSATEVKKAVTGYGRADKAQVQKMVRMLLQGAPALSADSADALALCLCHVQQLKLPQGPPKNRRPPGAPP